MQLRSRQHASLLFLARQQGTWKSHDSSSMNTGFDGKITLFHVDLSVAIHDYRRLCFRGQSGHRKNLHLESTAASPLSSALSSGETSEHVWLIHWNKSNVYICIQYSTVSSYKRNGHNTYILSYFLVQHNLFGLIDSKCHHMYVTILVLEIQTKWETNGNMMDIEIRSSWWIKICH